MLSENAEDYLACIWDLGQRTGSEIIKTTAIAAKLKLSPASVTEMTQKLAADGYLHYERYKGVTLTHKGKKVAERIKRKHRLLERFFCDVIGLRLDQSHDEAMKLEHTVSDESVEKLNQIMNYPKVCPDGDPIPPGEGPLDPDPDLSIHLTDLDEGEKGIITHLTCDETTKIKRLISMGFVPGRSVALEERVPMGGPLLVQLEELKVALARDCAFLVMVRKC